MNAINPEKRRLTNAYARDYYDTQVAPLASYEQDRWHSTPVQEFEYAQTMRALRHALQGVRAQQALEIGPGDGVWTGLLKERAERLHLVEQSGEMLARAKKRHGEVVGITFEHSDFQESNPPKGNDLIVAIRCFEYFEDKPAALRKMRDLLAPDGRIVIITKNPRMLTGAPVQGQTLHSGQVTPQDMQRLSTEAGLRIEAWYPAIFRWKARFAPMRALFDALHRIAVWSKGRLAIPFLTPRATESYVYILDL